MSKEDMRVLEAEISKKLNLTNQQHHLLVKIITEIVKEYDWVPKKQ